MTRTRYTAAAVTTSRWERLLDQKPIPVREHLIEETSQLLARELARWPLAVEELDLATGRDVAELLAPEAPRPDARVFREALRLARWDLGRETDAYDDYMRNARFTSAGLTAKDRPALLFIGRWLLEQLFALGEATDGRLRRADLTAILDRVERRLPAPLTGSE